MGLSGRLPKLKDLLQAARHKMMLHSLDLRDEDLIAIVVSFQRVHEGRCTLFELTYGLLSYHLQHHEVMLAPRPVSGGHHAAPGEMQQA
ncbi:hypothetical protein RRG08_030662 [Elysia crispata]|uniref:Uncharacterized protein n=1 Tax=Elysia crispata TaxID=231223 RepID=A0AAE1CYS8_9GAST|nr:hypothetical protein RRG08_030662 [Elysia crispata]